MLLGDFEGTGGSNLSLLCAAEQPLSSLSASPALTVAGLVVALVLSAKIVRRFRASRAARRAASRPAGLVVLDPARGQLAAVSSAAAQTRYPWNLSGGAHTPLQAAVARLATATLLNERLAVGARTVHDNSTGLRDLLEMVGGKLTTQGAAKLAEAEALLYHSGWTGPAWMDTTDLAGGFRQLHHFPQFRLAVSRAARLPATGAGVDDLAAICPPPCGWRLATAADLMHAGFRRFAQNKTPAHYYYMGQAGWQCCSWPERRRASEVALSLASRGSAAGLRRAGAERIYFLTADWASHEPYEGGSVHAQYTEGTLTGSYSAASLRRDLPTGLFGGVICVREDVPVPEEWRFDYTRARAEIDIG